MKLKTTGCIYIYVIQTLASVYDDDALPWTATYHKVGNDGKAEEQDDGGPTLHEKE